ncbi:hypothetical protein BATDEDRAFT_36049 [Batrachochytrium dendrobatidis JAM81]|uniref:Importin N-terminal domain-containing protein n=1 Tax=Batrachochytrium dendrobatidis (strain JAM81 / FGSC 10211) TaxID=684364 RepID=F4PBQ8_BATDJ|nr:importin-alpha export receptor [Batrachochytrium dendrobatidis JAM81]EGF77368.1 hypothetical protein BATDEDRAFT_36049 [Batrachochytrium dendrobatidis JAM81]KAJ8327553.1 importin-alpha export receptor [Batrachochytrium dendrobatidis]|eukprot:XP_006681999.1 hypothetical protein BATDEDRAFT_36049 [Batrachochytrium dendrobatidis JAM81]
MFDYSLQQQLITIADTMNTQEQQQLQTISECLRQTLEPATRKAAEQQLISSEQVPGFSILLLKLIDNTAVDISVRFAAALYFKNFTKKEWAQSDDGQDKIPEADRSTIKTIIVSLMITVPFSLRNPLSDAVTIIADSDFPTKWSNLLPDLVARLNLQDLDINVGVLQTAHYIFKRWRHHFRSDALYSEIKFAISQFAVPYLEFFKAIDSMIDASSADKPRITKLLEILLLLEKIFFSLNCHDLPEFFEDNQAHFMNLFAKYLTYQNSIIESDPDEAGPIEKIKSMTCEIIDLYARLYEDDFPRLPEFVQIIWTLLTSTSGEPKNNMLVNRMMSFLTSIVKPAHHRHFFEQPGSLERICGQIVLPNMELQTAEEELFEDDAIEYIRRDLEGSTSDSRRTAAAELVRGLLEHFSGQVTLIFSNYITKYLEMYEADRVKNWKAKDTALFLITALSAKSVTAQVGVTQINEHIPIIPVFSANVLPDIQAPVDGALNPIIKVDAIKYLTIFRSQLTKEQLMNVIPHVVNHLSSTNYVVHTWAAHAIERILALKSGNSLMFTPTDTVLFASSVIRHLFDRIESGRTPEKLAENDYLMKCIMRVIATARDQLPDIQMVLSRLTAIIKEISKNPSNPKFNHFVFESVALMIRFVSVTNPAIVADFELFLVQPFLEILQMDVPEFTPYVFQIFAQMLTLRPDPGLSPAYQQLMTPLLTPTLWQTLGNIPALVVLLQAYIRKGHVEIAQQSQLSPFLGVCQMLLGSRHTDQHGFDLLMTIFETFPLSVLTSYTKNIFVVLLTRLSQGKVSRFSTDFVKFICFLLVIDKHDINVDTIVEILDSVQPTPLFGGLLQSVLIPNLKNLFVLNDRKKCCVAMTRLLFEGNSLLSDAYINLWPTLFAVVLDLAEAAHSLKSTDGTDKLTVSAPAEDDPDILSSMDFAEDTGYQVSFVRLSTMGKLGKTNMVDGVADPASYLVQQVSKCNGDTAGMTAQEISRREKIRMILSSAPFQQSIIPRLQKLGTTV